MADNLNVEKSVNKLRDEWKKFTMGRLFVQRTARTRQQQENTKSKCWDVLSVVLEAQTC